MESAVVSGFKELLTHVGAFSSEGLIHNLNEMTNYLEVGRWVRSRGYECGKRASRREELFDRIAADVAEKSVLYLEFGVHQGKSIAYWSRILKSERAVLHGFDSFRRAPGGMEC